MKDLIIKGIYLRTYSGQLHLGPKHLQGPTIYSHLAPIFMLPQVLYRHSTLNREDQYSSTLANVQNKSNPIDFIDVNSEG